MSKKNNIKTAKDILLGHDFFAQRQLTEKYIHHEFQDYAYRLASTLGDLAHKPLYMRLSKTVPRHYLEKALAFTGDYPEHNKGRLFMWKLKQLREEAQLLDDNQNFDYSFVWQRMGKLYDELTVPLMQKMQKNADELAPIFTAVSEYIQKTKPRVLILDSHGGYAADMWQALGAKTEILENSRELVAAIKLKYSKLTVRKSQFTPGKYTDGKFDIIWCTGFWQLIPLELEQQFVQEFARLTSPAGLVIIEAEIADKAEQMWEQFNLGERVYYKFTKHNKSLELFNSYFELLTHEGKMVILRKLVD